MDPYFPFVRHNVSLCDARPCQRPPSRNSQSSSARVRMRLVDQVPGVGLDRARLVAHRPVPALLRTAPHLLLQRRRIADVHARARELLPRDVACEGVHLVVEVVGLLPRSVESDLDPIYDDSRLDRELVEGSHASKARLTAYLRVLTALFRGR